MLDLAGTKARECALVLGPRDACRADRALDVDDGRPNRRPPFSNRKLLGRHDVNSIGFVRLVWDSQRVSESRACEKMEESRQASSPVVGSDDELRREKWGSSVAVYGTPDAVSR